MLQMLHYIHDTVTLDFKQCQSLALPSVSAHQMFSMHYCSINTTSALNFSHNVLSYVLQYTRCEAPMLQNVLTLMFHPCPTAILLS